MSMSDHARGAQMGNDLRETDEGLELCERYIRAIDLNWSIATPRRFDVLRIVENLVLEQTLVLDQAP